MLFYFNTIPTKYVLLLRRPILRGGGIGGAVGAAAVAGRRRTGAGAARSGAARAVPHTARAAHHAGTCLVLFPISNRKMYPNTD